MPTWNMYAFMSSLASVVVWLGFNRKQTGSGTQCPLNSYQSFKGYDR